MNDAWKCVDVLVFAEKSAELYKVEVQTEFGSELIPALSDDSLMKLIDQFNDTGEITYKRRELYTTVETTTTIKPKKLKVSLLLDDVEYSKRELVVPRILNIEGKLLSNKTYQKITDIVIRLDKGDLTDPDTVSRVCFEIKNILN